jgi:hypothetical protein
MFYESVPEPACGQFGMSAWESNLAYGETAEIPIDACGQRGYSVSGATPIVSI